MKKILIVGAGASGLACAIKAKGKNNEVVVIEKNSDVGKKLLLTGNGKGNFFNDNFDISNYNSNNIKILKTIINDKNKKEILSFFDDLGIIYKIKNNYYYPFSNQANTIKMCLYNMCKSKNIKFIFNEEVLDIEYLNNNYIVKTSSNIYKVDYLVIATGSYAYPKTGSTGYGYEVAKKFKHKIINVVPALVSLIGKDNITKNWAGIRTEVELSLYENDKLVKIESGEIQLTDYGISGICVFQISSRISRGLNNLKKENVIINFMPYFKNKTSDEVIKIIDKKNKEYKNYNLSNLFEGLINYKLFNAIAEKNLIDKNKTWDSLNYKKKQELIQNLIAYNFMVLKTKDFSFSQVCAGGISLEEINIENFESKKQNNLFFIGEILDVDGECGGYNLAFAWLSGIKSGCYLRRICDKN